MRETEKNKEREEKEGEERERERDKQWEREKRGNKERTCQLKKKVFSSLSTSGRRSIAWCFYV